MVKVFFGTVRAYILNRYAEWRNNRLEHSKRRWVAHRINGGGVVPLGKLSQDDAISKCAEFGSVRYVDTEVAVIMYGDKTTN